MRRVALAAAIAMTLGGCGMTADQEWQGAFDRCRQNTMLHVDAIGQLSHQAVGLIEDVCTDVIHGLAFRYERPDDVPVAERRASMREALREELGLNDIYQTESG